MGRYSLVTYGGPDGEQILLTIWLPRLRSRPRLRFLRTVAEIHTLAAEMNARAQQRFGLDVVTVTMDSDDGDISMTFEFDPDFSDAYTWRDDIITSATRIIRRNGGEVYS
jgi:hypothetical protein